MVAGIFWLASYPKSGNTWLRSYIFALQNASASQESRIDINELDTGNIASCRAWLELGLGFDSGLHTADEIELYRADAYRFLHRKLTEPSYHKIHDANHLTASGSLLCPADACLGALYVVRNPFDVAISLANHMGISVDDSIRIMGQPDYALLASDKKITGQVRQRMGTWSQHVSSWLDCDLPQLCVRYEDMQQDPLMHFTAISQFLHLPTDPVSVTRALDLCHFDKLKMQEEQEGFKERPHKSKVFFRKGKVGDWRETLSQTQIEQLVLNHAEVMQRLGYLDAQLQITSSCHPDER